MFWRFIILCIIYFVYFCFCSPLSFRVRLLILLDSMNIIALFYHNICFIIFINALIKYSHRYKYNYLNKWKHKMRFELKLFGPHDSCFATHHVRFPGTAPSDGNRPVDQSQTGRVVSDWSAWLLSSALHRKCDPGEASCRAEPLTDFGSIWAIRSD